MLIRYFPRKSRSYRQALVYVFREQAQLGFVIRHNLRGATLPEWVQSFQANEEQRQSKSRRKDAVRLRHIVLSWHADDPVTTEAMEDMTRFFMQTYNPHAVYLAVAHQPDAKVKQPHVHIIAGGTDIFGRAIHLPKAENRRLKKSAEAYQREHYPEYVHSQIEHGRGVKDRQREYWLKKRGKTLYKEKLASQLKDIFKQAVSLEDFQRRLAEADLPTYQRSGKVVGIIYRGRKHRFGTLGIRLDRLPELERNR
ncbi:MAG: relaxase/mobilization nuclease domain-containing protein [Bacteroidota bacterium]